MIPRPVLRIALALLALATCSAPLAACGGAAGPVAKTRAVAFADAVNLRAGDVPSMGPIVSGFATTKGPPFGACTTRLRGSDEVAAVESSWYIRAAGRRPVHKLPTTERPPVDGVHSVVYVVRSSVLASRNVDAARSAGAPDCVRRLKVQEASGRFAGGEPFKLGLEASPLRFPMLGIGGYGLRVRGTLARAVFHQKKRTTFYEDTFGFAVGPAEIVLHTVGVARPFPSAVERRLLSLLSSRANAALS